jgi:hypothetical protein
MNETHKQTPSERQRLLERQVAQYVNESELPFSRPLIQSRLDDDLREPGADARVWRSKQPL